MNKNLVKPQQVPPPELLEKFLENQAQEISLKAGQLEIIKAIIFLISGGAGGYAVARQKDKRQTDQN